MSSKINNYSQIQTMDLLSNYNRNSVASSVLKQQAMYMNKRVLSQENNTRKVRTNDYYATISPI